MNRRAFLLSSSGATAGTLLVNGLPDWDHVASVQGGVSGLITGTPKPLRHSEILGFLSAAQIAPHHSAHYGGALTAFRNVEAQYEEALKDNSPPVDVTRFERLRQLQSSRGNSVILHELYFDGLGQTPTSPGTELQAAITKRFGSLDRWTADFVTAARSAAGWAMLIQHPVNGRLYNVVSDEHAQGSMWMAAPLVVIDTYEHAYYIDYQNRKADYIDRFLRHIDWVEAGTRYQRARG